MKICFFSLAYIVLSHGRFIHLSIVPDLSSNFLTLIFLPARLGAHCRIHSKRAKLKELGCENFFFSIIKTANSSMDLR